MKNILSRECASAVLLVCWVILSIVAFVMFCHSAVKSLLGFKQSEAESEDSLRSPV
jgi:hypothetical protein